MIRPNTEPKPSEYATAREFLEAWIKWEFPSFQGLAEIEEFTAIMNIFVDLMHMRELRNKKTG